MARSERSVRDPHGDRPGRGVRRAGAGRRLCRDVAAPQGNAGHARCGGAGHRPRDDQGLRPGQAQHLRFRLFPAEPADDVQAGFRADLDPAQEGRRPGAALRQVPADHAGGQPAAQSPRQGLRDLDLQRGRHAQHAGGGAGARQFGVDERHRHRHRQDAHRPAQRSSHPAGRPSGRRGRRPHAARQGSADCPRAVQPPGERRGGPRDRQMDGPIRRVAGPARKLRLELRPGRRTGAQQDRRVPQRDLGAQGHRLGNGRRQGDHPLRSLQQGSETCLGAGASRAGPTPTTSTTIRPS